jgi:hypothetical protein
VTAVTLQTGHNVIGQLLTHGVIISLFLLVRAKLYLSISVTMASRAIVMCHNMSISRVQLHFLPVYLVQQNTESHLFGTQEGFN